MMFETHPFRLPLKPPAEVLVLIGVSVSLVLAFIAARMEIEPFWLLLAALAGLLLPLLLQSPVLLMVALVYVGTFKTQAAVGVSLRDPTLLTAALLYVAVIIRVLVAGVGAGGYSLRELFAGQSVGVIAACLLVLVIAISWAYSPAADVGKDKVLKLLVFDLPAFLAPFILLRTREDVRHLLLLCMLGSLLLASHTMNRALHPTVQILLGQDDPTQISEGLLTGAAALMALHYPFRTKRLFHFGLIALIIVFTCGVIVSVSRSAILSYFIVTSCSLIFLWRRLPAHPRKRVLLAVAAVIVIVPVAFAFLWNLPAMHAKFVVKTAELTSAIKGTPLPGTADQRYVFSTSAINAFLAKPLLGWGAGGWSTLWHYSDDDRVVTYPHNFVLEIAAEQGLLGLSVLALLFLAALRAGVRILRDQHIRAIFILPVAALMALGNAVTGQIDDRCMWFFFGALFALARMTRVGDHSTDFRQSAY